MWIRFNGTPGSTLLLPANADDTQYMFVSAIIKMAVDDYVEVEVRQGSGGSLNILESDQRSMEFAMTRIAVG